MRSTNKQLSSRYKAAGKSCGFESLQNQFFGCLKVKTYLNVLLGCYVPSYDLYFAQDKILSAMVLFYIYPGVATSKHGV